MSLNRLEKINHNISNFTSRVVSISTVFVNKALFHSDSVKLDATLFVTWYQCIISALICYTMSVLGNAYPNVISFPQGSPFNLSSFKKVSRVILNFRQKFHVINTQLCFQVIPLSIAFTAMIATNNLCLRYVSVSFYYVGRCLSTVFNVILTYLVLKEKNSLNSILCCSMIVFGFLLGVDQESLTGKNSNFQEK